MRITHSMIAGRLVSAIQLNLEGLVKSQERMSTGKKVNRPSDDPSGTSQIMAVMADLSATRQYLRNIQDGLSWLNQGDATMGDATGLLHQARTLAVQGANGTLTRDDMALLAQQVDGIIDSMVNVGNASLGGKYIYAGINNNYPPFERAKSSDASGYLQIVIDGNLYKINKSVYDTSDTKKITMQTTDNNNITITLTREANKTYIEEKDKNDPTKTIRTITYYSFSGTMNLPDANNVDEQIPLAGSITIEEKPNISGGTDKTIASIDLIIFKGDSGRVQREISAGSVVDVNSNGKEVFLNQPAANEDQTKPNIFEKLYLLRDALNTGDYESVEKSLGNMDNAMNWLMEHRVAMGSRTSHLESLQSQLQDQEVRLTGVLSGLQDSDIARAAIEFQQKQLSYQAALSAGARLLQTSLLDYLR
ncbi:flagellar hook-associated protein FlgL [Desulfofundulus thermocisternus]|uniref:flagellar hook-associated protein FlgL n=1 Tax=Desulfofundulus thermocisternus TaxID=42471 RepID=UPI00217F11C8|nr:flagellar hook-associated protein FlgL [Desulfofundulus thermocisternus]MCS5696631.1 flagellar hook-associated protein FlgL [Desulfofundulus thermocisternus]